MVFGIKITKQEIILMKKILIVIADYYKDISHGLLKSAKENLPKNLLLKQLKYQGFLRYQLQYLKI